MKIKSLHLQNYKRFLAPKNIVFTSPDGEVNDVTLLIGDNGSGKSSILQAIIALVASASRENFDVLRLDWPGYEYRHLQSGKAPLRVEAEILFDKEEIATTVSYAKQLKEHGVKIGAMASQKPSVKLSLDYEKRKVQASNGALHQFSGYQYASRMSAFTPDKTRLFENVGNIYWYNEQRTLSNTHNLSDNTSTQIDELRRFLADSYHFHLAIESGAQQLGEGQFDFYRKIKALYGKVFLGRTLMGAKPRFDVFEGASAPDFFLHDGKNEYELSGMSAGERAIFPILMDFARWNINNSIVIIDEVELHLHPPLQQAFVRALPKLGKNNQFILTTHSDSVASLFDESQNEIIRLENE